MTVQTHESWDRVLKIVVIDDNKPTADRIANSIPWNKMGCEVVGVAYDGLSGKKIITQYLPDIVIIDIQMPYLSGLEIIEFTRPLIPHSKVIFISAYDEFEYAFKAIKLRAYDYLIKPFSQNDLVQVITKVVHELEGTQKAEVRHSDPIVERIAAYLDAHISENITLGHLSRIFGLSTGHLSQLIRQETGMRLSELAAQMRIEKAKMLLVNSEYNVGEISAMVGYKNYVMFYKAFKKEEGISPTEYVKESRKTHKEE